MLYTSEVLPFQTFTWASLCCFDHLLAAEYFPFLTWTLVEQQSNKGLIYFPPLSANTLLGS